MLRLTTVDDLMAGWSWEAYPVVDGYKYIVKDPQGQEWGRDYFSTMLNFESSIIPLRKGYAHTNPASFDTFEKYAQAKRFFWAKTKPRQVRKQGEAYVRECIKTYLRTEVHPKERPTIGVTYVGSKELV